jgi:two-component system response regulator YesN
MYNLLFADDEHIVREGISSRVDWGENGFKLTAVCENGREVLDVLRDGPVDVVLSDISMPLMDGLALCRHIAEEFPDVLVLLLTGHDQFEYAREALKYHVWELLLKPITASELETVLERVKAELDRRAVVRREEAALRARLAESIPLLRARFLYRLVLGQLTPDETRRRGEDLGWQDSGGWYRVGIVHLPSEWNDLDRFAVTVLTEEVAGPEVDIFTNREEDLVLLMQGPDRAALSTRSEEIALAILRKTSRETGTPVPVALGEPVPALDRLPASYRGARTALDYVRFLGLPQVITAGDLRARDNISVEEFHERAKQLIELLRENRGDDALELIESIFTDLEEHYIAPGSADAYLARIQFLLLDFMDELRERVNEQLPEEISSLLYARGYDSLPEAREHFQEAVREIRDYLRHQKRNATATRMERARTVIESRYTEPGLSLQDICEEVFLSVSQFSVLFKEHTGKTFVEYLTDYRIERARELLAGTDLRAYEVAERVGYGDPRYFGHVFKKATGMTSSEYRRQVRR